MKNVLITGGTGLVGKKLAKLLEEKGYQVFIASRQKQKSKNHCYWNVKEDAIDEEIVRKTNTIIHLAGANIGSKRWTSKRKKELIASRVETAHFLYRKIAQIKPPALKTFISASGVGFYGLEDAKIFEEDDKAGNDFLAELCITWENASLKFKDLGMRTVVLRMGVVFAKESDIFKKIVAPTKFGLGVYVGKGNQWLPWIHWKDLVMLFSEAVQNTDWEGTFNAVAPEQITYKNLNKKISAVIQKKILQIGIPSFLISVALGGRSVLVKKGCRISSKKVTDKGYQFEFDTVKSALKDLITSKN